MTNVGVGLEGSMEKLQDQFKRFVEFSRNNPNKVFEIMGYTSCRF